MALEQDVSGRYAAAVTVPSVKTFEYFAEFSGDGSTLTYPPDGARGPQRVAVIDPAGEARIALPAEALSGTDSATRHGTTVLSSGWGKGPTELGKREDAGEPEGPASFDVGPDGTVVVADGVNNRLVFLREGQRTNVPVADLPPVIVDVLLGVDGQQVFVLSGNPAKVTVYDLKGNEVESTPLKATVAGRLARARGAVWALGYPEQLWYQVSTTNGRTIEFDDQLSGGVARPSDDGGSVVVDVRNPVSRVARLAPDGVPDRVLEFSYDGVAPGILLSAEINAQGDGVVAQVWYTDKTSTLVLLKLRGDSVVSSVGVPWVTDVEAAPNGQLRVMGNRVFYALPTADSYTIVSIEL